MALISCQDLAIGYDGKTVAAEICFSVNPGDYLCIVGENGSGKTTLMKTLLGLIPPLSGTYVRGDGVIASDIGYLPQQTAVQRDFPASVREIVLSGCLNRRGFRPYYNKAEKSRADFNMERMGILKLSGCSYRELSGGQQQRVLLARALCAARRILLLDEPAAGLDPNASSEMYGWIQKINRVDGVAVMMISHDIDTALRFAGTVLHLGDRRPLYCGPVSGYTPSP